jgi:hypothetical protein
MLGLYTRFLSPLLSSPVGCLSDSLSGDVSCHVGTGPVDRANVLGVRADVSN